MLWRAVRRRCPHCGGRGWFKGWLHPTDRCTDCGYRFERQEGFMLGVMALNIIVTMGAIILAGGIGMALSWPDLAMVPIVGASVLVAVVVPIAFYPFAHYLWAVVDLQMRPLEPAEEADALTWMAARPTVENA
jgi:uncharacterized protein (DUF983 family)